MRPGKRIELAVCKTLEIGFTHPKKRDATYHCWNKYPQPCSACRSPPASLRLSMRMSRSRPGPGLKKNPDGTYSRTYDAAAEAPLQDQMKACRLGRTRCLLAAPRPRFTSIRRATGRRCQACRTRSATSAKSQRARDVDEARAARLARFTGDGPAQNQAAFEAPLASAAPVAASRPAAAPARREAAHGDAGHARAARRKATIPHEFFGGDSSARSRALAARRRRAFVVTRRGPHRPTARATATIRDNVGVARPRAAAAALRA